MNPFRTALVLGAALGLAVAPASADPRPRKQARPVRLAAGPRAASQDVGNVVVIVDNGMMVTTRNDPDLSGIALRFAPAGDHLFLVSRTQAALDPAYGPALTFGLPGSMFPGDDDSQEVPFPAGFPFLGTTWTSVWVNTDGNVTLGTPDFASTPRDKARHVLGPPRISGCLNDWWPQNALNPAGTGSIHAVVKTGPDRLVATWSGVTDYDFGGSSTFQIVLHADGTVDLVLDRIDPVCVNNVCGVAQGGGLGGIRQLDLSAISSPQSLPAGAIFEAFARFASVNAQEVAKDFYRTHPDKFDFLTVFTDFATNDFLFSQPVSNQTHGIGVILNPQSGEPFGPTVFDDSAAFGSAGELEQVLFMNNVMMMWPDAERLVNPPIEPFGPNSNIMVVPELFGLPVSLDGQPTTQNRLVGTLPPDDGEWSRHFRHGGLYGLGLMSHMALMAHETGHRWIAHLRFVHPTKGGDGLDSYDLLGRGIDHWSWFLNTGVPASQFGGAPRSSCMEGNAILDLGVIPEWNGTPTNLDPGERVFRTPADQLIDGWSALDQHLMGLRRAADVGPFFYVDEPRSLYTGQSLDVFDPQNPLNTEVTMRGWQPLSGVVFKGKRVDLTIANIQDHEKQRERRENPQGRRFWGPKGNLTVRYFSDTRRVDPAGNASTVLSTADRELGDEADRIEPDGRPVDVKTMAFVLLVQQGPPQSHGSAIGQVETLRGAWQEYANGPASGGRGRFDTSLDPTVY